LQAALKELDVSLTSHPSWPEGRDKWFVESVDIKIRNPNGTLVCEQIGSANPLAVVTDGAPLNFPTPACVPPPPVQEAVECSVFDDGYTNIAGPSGAVYIESNGMHACVPDNTSVGTCRKWFGRCVTVQRQSPVFFYTFDDGYTNKEGPSDAVYINALSSGIDACLPSSGNGPGLCHKWFGKGFTGDGRSVTCAVFDDGTANQTNQSDAVFVLAASRNDMKTCVPGNPLGICRKWFGTCVAQ
jgi:hypothetical protein